MASQRFQSLVSDRLATSQINNSLFSVNVRNCLALLSFFKYNSTFHCVFSTSKIETEDLNSFI